MKGATEINFDWINIKSDNLLRVVFKMLFLKIETKKWY